MTKMLCLRPKIMAEESVSSYIFRLTSLNHYPTEIYLSEFLGLSSRDLMNNRISDSAFIKLARISNSFKEDLQKGMIRFFTNGNEEIVEKYLLLNKVKYCPYCIQNYKIHKISWGLLPIHVCFIHNVELVDSCDTCQKDISLKELFNGQCKRCLFKYKNVNKRTLSLNSIYLNSQLDLYRRIFVNDNTGYLSLNEFFKLSYHFFYLLESLPSFVETPEKVIETFPNKPKQKQSSSKIASAFANIFWILQNPPSNLRLLLDAFIKYKKGTKNFYVQKNSFEQIFKQKNFKWIKDIYDCFWIEKADEGIIRKDFSIFKDTPSLLSQRKYLRKDEIRVKTGMSYELIEKLSNSQELDMIIKDETNIRKYFIDRESYFLAMEQKSHLSTKQEAASTLGITRDSVSKLIKAGLLNTKDGYSNNPMLYRDEVQSLLKECRGKYKNNLNNHRTYFSLNKVLIKYSVNRLSLESIITFTKQKMLSPISLKTNGTLTDNYYDEAELKKCIQILKERHQKENGYYMHDVMSILKIGEKKMHRFMKEGKIIPMRTITYKGGRKRYIFSKETIDQLAELIH